ncbi:MAG: hypothetical protein ACREHG_11050 [Candidatus Saccharimonadales bacterium]
MPIDKKAASKIISLVSHMASDGVVTEKIALLLRGHLNQKQNQKLREQLTLSYLRKF